MFKSSKFTRENSVSHNAVAEPRAPAMARESEEKAGMKRSGERTRGVSIPSVLSVGLKIVGNVESPGELHIDGTVEGDVRGGKITLGEEGRVSGTITADTARISGSVDGEIRVGNVTLTKSAKVRGDIHHENLGMEPGALLEGMVRRIGSEQSRGDGKVSVLRPAKSNADSGTASKRDAPGELKEGKGE